MSLREAWNVILDAPLLQIILAIVVLWVVLMGLRWVTGKIQFPGK